MSILTPSAAKPDYWDSAVSQLMRRDRIMKKLIPQHPEVWLTTRGNPFVTLARSIVGQQISVKAAESVWQRFLATCGRRGKPAPGRPIPAQGRIHS